MGLLDRLRRRNLTTLDPSFGALIGDLAGPIARIAPDGAVATLDGSWRLEWGVRIGREWKRSSTSVAVRQNRLDDTPVYETWMRVPGGDVIQRSAVVTDGNGRTLVWQFENASPDAVVVAVVGLTQGRVHAELSCTELDGVPWIRPCVDAGAVVAGPEIWSLVEADPTAASADGENEAAVLVPLPHRQTITVLVSITGDLPARPTAPEDVAAGWKAITADAMTVDVPDVDLSAAWRRVLGDLVLAVGDDDPIAAGEAAWWLDLAGMHDEADRGREAVLAAADRDRLGSDAAVVALRALASKELRQGASSALAEVAGPLAKLARDRLDRQTVSLVARALDGSHPGAAADARALLDTLTLADRAMSSAVARGAERVLGHLFRDIDLVERIDMLPEVPTTWFGQPIDVRGMVTGLGSLSFSVRWHRERPAVLWQRDGGPDGAVLRCPGLDPDWSSSERSGEALLEAPAGSETMLVADVDEAPAAPPASEAQREGVRLDPNDPPPSLS